MRQLLVALSLALVFAPVTAIAKSPTSGFPVGTPRPGQLTTTDLRGCMGLNGSTAEQQVTLCTKIINSGKVKAPYTGDYYATRAAAYLSLNKPDKALADINKALTFRKAAEFYLQRGVINMALHNAEPAKADLSEVIRLKPEIPLTYLLRGLVAYEEGNFADAIAYFDKAVTRKPKYYQAIFARGVAKKRNGDEGGDRDIADARALSTHVDKDLARYGLTP